jgi:C4-dicarboxylate transporter, DcuC family
MLLGFALLIIVLSLILIIRGVDVRLVLFGAALAIAGVAGDVRPIFRAFYDTFSNAKFVIPICSAMGFAYAMRHAGCDRDLVQLLLKPLRNAKYALIPGTVIVGFLVNIPVISQTSTAVCIGAVVVPLLRSAGLSPITTGASLILGSSIGGELFNPGAPELNTVATYLKMSSTEVVPAIPRFLLPHLVLTTIIFTWFMVRYERRGNVAAWQEDPTTFDPNFKINLFRALVPVVPLILLFITAPPLSWVKIPDDWLVDIPKTGVDNKLRETINVRLIALAMLVGVLLCAIANPKKSGGLGGAFFDGAGYALANVVSLIVVANCFGKAIELIGFKEWIAGHLAASPMMLQPVAASLGLGFAWISGSGMAATQSLYDLVAEPAEAAQVDPIDVGAVLAIGSAAGRTMSPVAAVVLMSGKLTGVSPLVLIRYVTLPLILSLSVIMLFRMAGLL